MQMILLVVFALRDFKVNIAQNKLEFQQHIELILEIHLQCCCFYFCVLIYNNYFSLKNLITTTKHDINIFL